MKTLIVKSIMMIIIIVAMVHYALYLRTGKLPWSGWQGETISLPTSLPILPTSLSNAEDMLPSSKTRVYKWVDEQGVLNYSQEPPPASITSKAMDVDANVNLIQGTPLPQIEESDTSSRPRSVLLGESGYGEEEQTPIEKAEEARALLEEREKEMKKILDSL
jgi:hypothetical protein